MRGYIERERERERDYCITVVNTKKIKLNVIRAYPEGQKKISGIIVWFVWEYSETIS